MLKPHDDYDNTFEFRYAMAPAIWLAIAGACMMVALYAVGYLAEPDSDTAVDALKDMLEQQQERGTDHAARRATLAFSGVTAGITLALCFTCAYWAREAFRGKAKGHQVRVVVWVAVLLVSSGAILWGRERSGAIPFTSQLGWALLQDPHITGIERSLAESVPYAMFLLACVVPAILTAGACVLLQPMRDPASTASAREQVRVLAARLKELDQLLYIGALTLVFGTLQLSTALSVPLASTPKLADVKTKTDLCKALAPAAPASVASAAAPAQAAASVAPGPAMPDMEPCRSLIQQFKRVDQLDSLRQLARGVTLSFGLAYSVFLATIYVPGILVLRRMSHVPQKIVDAAAASGGSARDEKPALGDVDPMGRIAAIVATLSPLIAGILANAFAT